MTTPFWTHYSVGKNEIFLRWFDETGKKRIDLLPFKPSFYIQTDADKSNSDFTTLDGKPLRKIDCESISDFRYKISEYKDISQFDLLGTRNAALEYVVKTFDDNVFESFNADLIRRLNIDIETEVEVSVGFPSVENAEEAINLITAMDSKRKRLFVFYTNDFDTKSKRFEQINYPIHWIYCEDEKTLLSKFIHFWVTDYPDIVCGWNIGNFDIPYIVNRIEKVLGVKEAERLSPVGDIKKSKTRDEKGRDLYKYTIRGVEVVDSIELYKKIELDPRESYSLDNIASVELGVGKLHHPSGIPGHKLYKKQNLKVLDTNIDWEEWNDHREICKSYLETQSPIDAAKAQRLFHEAHTLYNIVDVVRSFEIEEKLSLFEILYFLTYFSASNYSDSLSSMKTWANLLYKYCFQQKKVFNLGHSKGDKEGNFTGAYVREPIIGRYTGIGCIVTYDVASMYPNLIRTLNISPEKLTNLMVDVDLGDLVKGIFPDLKNLMNGVSKVDYAMGANGATFKRDGIGILPAKVAELFTLRKAKKKEAQKMEAEINEIENELRKRGVSFDK